MPVSAEDNLLALFKSAFPSLAPDSTLAPGESLELSLPGLPPVRLEYTPASGVDLLVNLLPLPASETECFPLLVEILRFNRPGTLPSNRRFFLDQEQLGLAFSPNLQAVDAGQFRELVTNFANEALALSVELRENILVQSPRLPPSPDNRSTPSLPPTFAVNNFA
ncbi:MAG: hypothetical protein LBU79_02145 [Planctomycetota bacterium]|jgi:hypothetical protein|nr:hypothetical protein [Planctomycetota bacterium]